MTVFFTLMIKQFYMTFFYRFIQLKLVEWSNELFQQDNFKKNIGVVSKIFTLKI